MRTKVSDALDEQKCQDKQTSDSSTAGASTIESKEPSNGKAAEDGNGNAAEPCNGNPSEWSCIGLRRFCQRVVRLQGIRLVMLVLVVISCVALAFHKKGESNIAVSAMEILMVTLFCIEFAAKVLANGWKQKVPAFPNDGPSCLASVVPEETNSDNPLAPKKDTFCGWEKPLFCTVLSEPEVTEPFCASFWNNLDFFILLCCLFDLLLLMSGWAAAVFVLRPFKALRVVTQLTSLQRVVYTLVQALPMLVQICIFILFVFGVFAILGVAIFVGKSGYCTDLSMTNGTTTILNKAACVGYFEDTSSGSTVLVPRAWVKYDQTFDNVAYAMLTLLEVSSCDGWSGVMYNAVNMVGKDDQPVIGSSEIHAYYFIAFIFLSSMFVFQMFVAVVCDSFFHAHGFFDRSNEQSQLRNLLRLLEMLIPEEAPAPPQIAVSDSIAQYAL